MIFRKIFPVLEAHLVKKEISLLIGPRQTGKSTLLRQLEALLRERGEEVVLLNLERKDILLELNQNPENVFKFLSQNTDRTRFVLIDEVQYLIDPTHFLKLLYDEYAGKLKMIATGSSAFYLDRQFKDSLAGRKRIFELPTLDFEEYLQFSGQEEVLEALQTFHNAPERHSPLEARIWSALDTYLIFGGYPAVVLAGDAQEKIDRLRELRDAFVKRDILEANITDEDKFYRLFILLAGQSGALLNMHELAKTIRIPYAVVEEYVYVLQKCFHLSLLKPYYQNLKKELTKMPKVYLHDMGMRNILLNYFEPISRRVDKGEVLESYIYRLLRTRYGLEQVKYWRTSEGNEVDFVISEGYQRGFALEVKFNPVEQTPGKYKKFTESYPELPLRFLSWGDRELLSLGLF